MMNHRTEFLEKLTGCCMLRNAIPGQVSIIDTKFQVCRETEGYIPEYRTYLDFSYPKEDIDAKYSGSLSL